ncbi:MAG TPA: hypothetical protein GXX28_00590 [Firmicutes bacterium]|nr:hypothetical protein [Bacillota bacterium]
MLLQLTKPAPPEAALCRLLGERLLKAEGTGSGDHLLVLAERAARRAADLAEPRAAAGPYTVEVEDDGRRALERISGKATPLAVVVTVGEAVEAEVRRLFGEGRATEALLLDTAGNLVLGTATREACQRLEGVWLSPGCHELPFSLLPSLVAAAEGGAAGVQLLPGGMLSPEKTVAGLAVKAAGERPPGCRCCASAVCPWRGGGEP